MRLFNFGAPDPKLDDGSLATLEADQRLRELEALRAAIGKSQAVIEFSLDGTIITANDNFVSAMGYTLPEIVGQHHRMFVDPSEWDSEGYRRFWERLRSGTIDAAQYKRIGKDGRDVWIQASYNPLFDAEGRPTRWSKFATDITAQVKASRALDNAVQEIQQVVRAVLDGEDQRISTQGVKTYQLATLTQSLNLLIGNVLDSVGDTKSAVQLAIDGHLRERISLGEKTGHFRSLGASINALIDTTSVVKTLRTTADEVLTGSAEIASGNPDLSQRTEQTASNLQQTAARCRS